MSLHEVDLDLPETLDAGVLVGELEDAAASPKELVYVRL